MTRPAGHGRARRGVGRTLLTVAVALLGLVAAACGDGTPSFCTDLARQADLRRLAAALDAGDLPRAAREADRLRQLAGSAPDAVRSDLTALADGLAHVVDVVRDQQGGADPTALERRRDQLNERLAELGRRSRNVSAWASRECGVDL